MPMRPDQGTGRLEYKERVNMIGKPSDEKCRNCNQWARNEVDPCGYCKIAEVWVECLSVCPCEDEDEGGAAEELLD